jgi:histidinol-phosphate aminotransferase
VLRPERVLELAERLPCPLLVDEAYVDFAETSCLRLVAKCEKVMVSRSLSKSHALAGLRFGFLVAQPQLIRQFVKVKDSYNCDALSIAGAWAAIDDRAWLAQTRAKIVHTRQRLTDAMLALGFAAVPSQANFVWCPHPRVPVRPLYEQLKAQGVLVRYMNYSGWRWAPTSRSMLVWDCCAGWCSVALSLRERLASARVTLGTLLRRAIQ